MTCVITARRNGIQKRVFLKTMNGDMLEIIDERVSRRSYLKYLATAVVVAGAAAIGAYEISESYRKQTPSPSPTITPTLNPVVEYALDKGIASDVAEKLDVLSELNDNNKILVDYLFSINDLLPSYQTDKEEEIKSLQVKVLDGSEGFNGILTNREVSSEEASALKYLSKFNSAVQNSYIQFGLDETVSKYLFLMSSQVNPNFAGRFVPRRLCIEDHKLTDLEVGFLCQPTDTNGSKVVESYINDAKADVTFPELGEELEKIPELSVYHERADAEIVEAVEDLVYSISRLKDSEIVRRNVNEILNEGIKEKRKYCTPLEALLWIAYDHDDEVSNILTRSAKEGYYVMGLLMSAWKKSVTSANYTSPRWKDFNEVVDRLNSPTAVSVYTGDNIVYRPDPFEEWVPAQLVFQRRYDDCDGFATLQAYFLRANGYDAWMIALPGTPKAPGHSVCGYKHKGLWQVLDVGGARKGPFNSLDELGDYFIPGCSIILFNPFDINRIYRSATFDLRPIIDSIPHIVYRRRKES